MRSKAASQKPASLVSALVCAGLWMMLASMSLAVGTGWLIPVEIAQNWAVQQVPPDNVFAQFEAAGRAQAVWWLFAYLSPIFVLVSVIGLRKRQKLSATIAAAMNELLELTATHNQTLSAQAVCWIKRILITAMLLLGFVHTASGFWDRIKDWPYYELRSGDEVLPNISDSNRAVIRYLQATTPEDARIFVASDQKLYFLSYYLWPRQLYHVVHPEAAHLIPRANQARQLAAYRLQDIPPNVIHDHQPDFILEYFEGPEYVQPERNLEDVQWVNFSRQLNRNAAYLPPYTVVLQPADEVISE